VDLGQLLLDRPLDLLGGFDKFLDFFLEGKLKSTLIGVYFFGALTLTILLDRVIDNPNLSVQLTAKALPL
jgi:hypothetical protein